MQLKIVLYSKNDKLGVYTEGKLVYGIKKLTFNRNLYLTDLAKCGKNKDTEFLTVSHEDLKSTEFDS